MFVDYLKINYWLPNDGSPPGCALAEEIWNRGRILGEARLMGSSSQKFQVERRGRRVILEWGGSKLPLDLHDFVRMFRRFRHWNLSRLDLAENVPHLSRDMVHFGDSRTTRDFYEVEPHFVDGEPVRIWTGCTIGSRGMEGTFFRAYDARRHIKGRNAKIARHGSCDFWRVEYELSRRFFRAKGILLVQHLTVDLLLDLWASETHKKGVAFDGTSEYRKVSLREVESAEIDLADWRRMVAACGMIRNMHPLNRERFFTVAAEMAAGGSRGAENGFRPRFDHAGFLERCRALQGVKNDKA